MLKLFVASIIILLQDVPDSTVEDIYIDDEFGDDLNVNMVLLDEDLSIDEDFLPDISEL